MASELFGLVYRTRVGNIPAKSVLIRLANSANLEGFGYPSLETVARETEIKLRTVKRIVQVFEQIGLVRREIYIRPKDSKKVTAWQIDLSMLEVDISSVFAAAYAAAQGKLQPLSEDDNGAILTPSTCLRDTDVSAPQDVAETLFDVAETRNRVAETFPPDPHIGGTVIEPSVNPPPNPPAGGVASPDDALTPEQELHLAAIHSEVLRVDYRTYYLRENREAREKAACEIAEQLAQAEERARLRAEMPTIDAARAWVMRRCGFANGGRRRNALAAAVDAVLREESSLPSETAQRIVKAWENWIRNGDFLRPQRVGPVKFFEHGIWRDERLWPWDQERLDRYRGASIGSRRAEEETALR